MSETNDEKTVEKSKAIPAVTEKQREKIRAAGRKVKEKREQEIDPFERNLGKREATDLDRSLQAMAKAAQPLPELKEGDSRVRKILTHPRYLEHRKLPDFTKEPWAEPFHFEWHPANPDRFLRRKLASDTLDDGTPIWALVTRSSLPSVPREAVDALTGLVMEDWLGGDPHAMIMCRKEFHIAKFGKAHSAQERAMGAVDIPSEAAKISHERITQMEETGTAAGLPSFD